RERAAEALHGEDEAVSCGLLPTKAGSAERRVRRRGPSVINHSIRGNGRGAGRRPVMTMAIECPTRAVPTQCVLMTHITRRAERQVKKLLRGLPRRDRERLVAALLRPVPSDLCGMIKCQERRRLFHFRPALRHVTRVCYATLNGPHVVILDVAAHDDFEEFA